MGGDQNVEHIKMFFKEGLTMKQIILVRHATAAAKGPRVDDFSRSLRKRGRKESQTMADWYKKCAATPDLLISSPAHRAIETAEIFAEVIGYRNRKIVKDQTLYGGLSPNDFLVYIKKLDDHYNSVMIFGHDPEFTEFAQHIVTEYENGLPKCGVLGIGLNRKYWRMVRPGDGRIEFYEHPAGLLVCSQEEKQIRSEMSTRIEKGIWDTLTGLGIISDDVNDKVIQRASDKIAKKLSGKVRTRKRTTPKVKLPKKKTTKKKTTKKKAAKK
jgi:phosphohistidine phosphatase